jgi:hypothetical protein
VVRRWGRSVLPHFLHTFLLAGFCVLLLHPIPALQLLPFASPTKTQIRKRPGTWDRRLTYAAAGVTNALSAILLVAANRLPVYLAGTFFYLATQGLCWARSVALIVEIVGPETRDASTLYSLLNTAASVAALYVIWLDGVGFRHFWDAWIAVDRCVVEPPYVRHCCHGFHHAANGVACAGRIGPKGPDCQMIGEKSRLHFTSNCGNSQEAS